MPRTLAATSSILVLLMAASVCSGQTLPAPPPATLAWISLPLSPEQLPSRPPVGPGPLEKLVDDFFGQLVTVVAEYPGSFFTLAVSEFEDPSGEIGARGHLRNLLLLRLIETGRFKIVSQRQTGEEADGRGPGSGRGAGGHGGRGEPSAARPDLTLRVSIGRIARWVSLCGLLSSGAGSGPERVLLAATDRDASLDELLRGETAQSTGGGFEVKRLGSVGEGVLDAAAADLEGSGRDDLILLSTRSVKILKLEGGAAKEIRTLAFPEVPRAIHPPRSPRGTVTALPRIGEKPARVLASVSDLRLPVEWDLAASQARTSPLGEVFPLAPGRSPSTVLVGKLWHGRNYFDSSLVWAEPSSNSKGAAQALPFLFYGLKRGRGGAAEGVGVLDTDWVLHLLTGDLTREIGRVERCGAAFAVLNLLEDGSWEVLASSPATPGSGEKEKLSVYRVSSAGSRLVWQTEGVSGSICSIASGDFSGSGSNDGLAIECGESPSLLLVRRVGEKAP